MNISRRRLLGSTLGLLIAKKLDFLAQAAEFEIPNRPIALPNRSVPGKSLHDFRLGLISPDFDRPIWAPGFSDIIQNHPRVIGPLLTFTTESLQVAETTRFQSVLLIDPNGVLIAEEAFFGHPIVTIPQGNGITVTYRVENSFPELRPSPRNEVLAAALKPYLCEYIDDMFVPGPLHYGPHGWPSKSFNYYRREHGNEYFASEAPRIEPRLTSHTKDSIPGNGG